jgi:hypothetical protein
MRVASYVSSNHNIAAMKQSIILKILFFLIVVSCTPDFFLPDQHLKFSDSQKFVYSFNDTLQYKNNNNQDENYKITRFYYGTLGHTLTGTDYKGAQAYCDYEFLTFCKIGEPISCDSIYKNDKLTNKNHYGLHGWFSLKGYINECNKCFSIIKFMEGDREKEKKLKAVLYWNNVLICQLNTDVKISEIEINGINYFNVYKTDINGNNIKKVYYSNQYGIIQIEFLGDTFNIKN